MNDWTEGFGEFIDTLVGNKSHIYKEGKSNMVHELAKNNLKRMFRLFFTPAVVGVSVIEGDEGEYGVYLLQHHMEGFNEEDQLLEYMNQYDPDWVIWTDKDGKWGATAFVADVDPTQCSEKEYAFDTHNFNKAMRKLFEVFTDTFFEDIQKDASEYMKYD